MSDRLAFVAHPAQHAVWMAAGSPGCPATGDFNVLDAFLTQGTRHIDLWSFLSEEDLTRHDAEAWEFCRNLSRRLAEAVCWKEANFGSLCRFDPFWSVRGILNTHQAACRAMSEGTWSGVIHFAEMREADLFDLPDRPADLFNASAACAARTQGVRVELLHLPATRPVEQLFQPLAAGQQASGSGAPWPNEVDVLCVAEGLGLDEQARLLREPNGTGAKTWAAVTGTDITTAIPSASLRLLRWLPWDMKGLREAAAALVHVPAWIRDGSLPAPAFLAEPEFAFVWQRLSDWMVQGAAEHRLTRLLARGWRPRTVVMGSDIFGTGRCAAQGWMDQGTEVLAIDHVGLGWSSSHRWHEGTKTHLATWGEVDAKSRRLQKQSHVRVEAVGSLRTDFEKAFSAGPVDRAEGPVAVFTSETSSGLRMHGWSTPRSLRAAWDVLIAGAEEADARLVIKPHPRYDHPAFYERLCAARGSRATFVRGHAGEALSGASVAILVNTPSTVLIQCIAAGVPVLYLRKGVAAFSDPPIPADIIPVVDDAKSLATWLRRLRTDTELRQSVQTSQRAWLSTVLAATGETAAGKMRSVVDALGRQTSRQPPEPAARWLLEVITAVNDLRRGVLSAPTFTQRMRQLSSESAVVVRLSEEGLDPACLPEYLLRVIVWADWPEGSTRRRLEALRLLRTLLPRSLRPRWRALIGPARTILEQARTRREGNVV